MATAAKKRAGRPVVVVNAGVSIGLLALIAGVALVVNPPAPPGIAAFAPQAAKPITKAPLGQSSTSGKGTSAGGAGCSATSCPTPTPTLADGSPSPVPHTGAQAIPIPTATVVAGVPSALQCASWPDGSVTQTFDPQSPPCIASWPGAARGNGGATSAGVTGTEIRVAYPQLSSGSQLPNLLPLVNFVNTHFELYGRKIVLVPFTSAQESATSSSTNSDPQAQQADAAAVTALQVFAATDFVDGSPTALELPSYAHTLAQHHIITVAGGEDPPLVSSGQLAAHAPYEYSYSPAIDQLLSSTASMVCRSLVGRDATHASAYAKRTRKFALLIPESAATGGQLDGLSSMKSTLSSCGITDPEVVSYDASDNNGAAPLRASLLKLKNDGVTSLIYFPWWYDSSPLDAPQIQASAVDYRPEWVTMSWQATNTSNLTMNTGSSTSTFGVMEWNKLFAPSVMPWYEAYTADGSSTEDKSINDANGLYHELLLLASGVQLAGPNLTPQTFAAALRSTTFPNPGAAAAPSYQGHVGFQSGNGVMVDDFGGFWFKRSTSSATTTDENTNGENPYDAYCYLGLGRRISNGAWPSTDGYYSAACS